MKTAIITITIILAAHLGFAQPPLNKVPEVGKPMLDFELSDVQFYSKNKVSLADFKGQWLILDFWNQYCAGCIASHPRMNALQNKLLGKVQFVLIGYTGSQYLKVSNNKSVRDLYERNRLENNLTLPIAFDSLLMHRFDIKPTPYIIIIDPMGVVRGITYEVTEEDIVNLMAGKQVALPRAYRGKEREKLVREMIKRKSEEKKVKGIK